MQPGSHHCDADDVPLTFGGDGGRDPIRNYYIGGFQIALNAIDALRRQLPCELGPHGGSVAD